MNKFYVALIGVIVVLGVFATPTHAVDHASSQFNQSIMAVDCTDTSVSTGVGESSVLGCPEPPEVGTLTIQSGQSGALTGWYDSSNSVSLSVTFNGVTYVLGVDSALTVSGDEWTLNIPDVIAGLQPGSYGVAVQTEMNDGQTLIGSGVVIVRASGDDGGSDDGDDGAADGADEDGSGSGAPGVPNTGFWLSFADGATSEQWMAVAVMVLLLACAVLGGYHYGKKHAKKP